MSINLQQLRTLLKATGLSVYRDKAPTKATHPFIVYSFISEGSKRASGSIYKRLPLYQVSLFTKGTEEEFNVITKKFNENKVPFSTVMSVQGDENDDTITNFFTNVRCVEDV